MKKDLLLNQQKHLQDNLIIKEINHNFIKNLQYFNKNLNL